MSLETTPYTFFIEFALDPPIQLPPLKISDDITLKKDHNGLTNKIEIKVNGLLHDVVSQAKERVEQFLSLISLNLGNVTNGNYQGYYRFVDKKVRRTVIVKKSIAIFGGVQSNKPNILDLERQLNIRDVKYWRQMNRFHKAEKSKDSVKRFRYYYQVLEDENHPFSMDEKAIRHTLSHPKIDDPRFILIVERLFSSNFFNPNNMKHISIVKRYADNLQTTARNLMKRK